MSVEVIVPWWAVNDCPHRERAWDWIEAHYGDLPVSPAVSISEVWVKAEAVMPAIARSQASVIVVADADVWCDGLPTAVGAVEAGAAWAVPHFAVRRLNEQATAGVVRGLVPEMLPDSMLEEPPYRGVAGGGIVVLRRDVALDVPMDPRFRGWGGEDHAWGYALRTLHGDPWRGETPLWHLWHPSPPRLNRRVGNQLSETLRRRYQRAMNDRPAMRALVDEAKAVTCG